jgi:hypothetical protein
MFPLNKQCDLTITVELELRFIPGMFPLNERFDLTITVELELRIIPGIFPLSKRFYLTIRQLSDQTVYLKKTFKK